MGLCCGRVGLCCGRMGLCYGCMGLCYGCMGLCCGRVGLCCGRMGLCSGCMRCACWVPRTGTLCGSVGSHCTASSHSQAATAPHHPTRRQPLHHIIPLAGSHCTTSSHSQAATGTGVRGALCPSIDCTLQAHTPSVLHPSDHCTWQHSTIPAPDRHSPAPSQLAGRDAPSNLIAFAQKTLKEGNIVSKLHVIELGGPPGVRLLVCARVCVRVRLCMCLCACKGAWRA